MHTNHIQALKKRKGTILWVTVACLVIVCISACIAGSTLTVESIQRSNVSKIQNRYDVFSAEEIAAYDVITYIQGKYVDEINISYIENQIKNETHTVLENNFEIEVVDNLLIDNSIQIKIYESSKTLVLELNNITLDEMIETVGLDEIVRYLIDVSECNISRYIE